MPKPNYQREKRLKDLARQQKQEEKRSRKLLKDETPGQDPLPEGEGEAGEPALES